MGDKLTDWINTRLKEMGWSQSELSKRSDVSRPLISQVLSGDKPPSADFCIKIAPALGETPEKLLRLAGILPAAPASEEGTLQELIDLARSLPPEDQVEVLKYARFRHQQRKG